MIYLLLRIHSQLMRPGKQHDDGRWRPSVTSLRGEIRHVQLSLAGSNSRAHWDCAGTSGHWPHEECSSVCKSLGTKLKCQSLFTSAKLRFREVKRLQNTMETVTVTGSECNYTDNKKKRPKVSSLFLIIKSIILNKFIRSVFSCPNRTTVKNTRKTVKQSLWSNRNPYETAQQKSNLCLSVATVSTCTAFHQPK